ncbi:MAG: aminotransferase class V-fold PLP-dependent enzyme [Chloroflexi bacterium]|nr:aminotransferase class V-fold PLP-dependent enzyme [Chloroflexota bacterium]
MASVSNRRTLLRQTAELAADFLEGLPERPVYAAATREELLESLGGPMPDRGEAPGEVVNDLAAMAEPGLVASAGPRYFGFVIGGSLPSALAADWLTSAWDQNGFAFVMSPAAMAAEEIASGWLLDLFGLPAECSVGFTTGVTMASFTGLAAGRHAVLERVGYDVEGDGLTGAPEIAVVVGAEAHASVFASLQMLGFGKNRVHSVEADGQGRMRPDALRTTLVDLRDHPALVIAQSGNVNTGAFDPLAEIVQATREHPNSWLHVDGAFGLWATAAPSLRHLADGIDGADSWSTDAHKWLNVPYDSGIAIVRDPAAHRAAVMHGAAYYVAGAPGERDGGSWVPDSSRRARGFALYAALRELGRTGLAELIERSCELARRLADGLRDEADATILNDVVLNQVLVRFSAPGMSNSEADAYTRAVIAAVQADGTCWLGGTVWHGMAAMRISVSNWSTTEADIDVSAAAIRRCRDAVAANRDAPTPAG